MPFTPDPEPQGGGTVPQSTGFVPDTVPPDEPSLIKHATTWTLDALKKGALPGIESAIGGALGIAAMPFATPVMGPAAAALPFIGYSGGSMMGEIHNQALGITEPSTAQIGWAGAAPPMAEGAMAGGKAVLRKLAPLLPGASTVLRRVGIAMAKALPKIVRPEIASDEIVKDMSAAKLNPFISLDNVKQWANEVNAIKGVPGLEGTNTLGEKLATMQGGGDRFQSVWKSMKELNGMIADAKKEGGTAFGQLMQAKKAFWADLENHANNLGGKAYETLKKFNGAVRNEIASEHVDDIVFKNFGQALEGTSEWSSAAAQAHRQLSKAIRDDPFLADSFPSGTLQHVLDTFDKIRQLPVRGAAKGVDAGSKNVLTREIIGKAVGGITGLALEHSGIASGAAAAYVGQQVGGASAVVGYDLISRAIQSPKGSAFLLKLLRSPGGFDAPKAAVLTAFMRAQTDSLKPNGRGNQ